jgi:O-acetyl-ADP-ribose deacetylase (regulator of RNase III)
MIRYKNGNVINFTEDAIVHGCNCFKTMGAGVAKQIKIVYPELYMADSNHIGTPKERLGNYTKAGLKNGKTGYNVYSQYSYGGGINLDYNALKKALELVKSDMISNGLKSIAMPKIGAGLAGGDWIKIEQTLTEVFNNEQAEAVVYEFGR